MTTLAPGCSVKLESPSMVEVVGVSVTSVVLMFFALNEKLPPNNVPVVPACGRVAAMDVPLNIKSLPRSLPTTEYGVVVTVFTCGPVEETLTVLEVVSTGRVLAPALPVPSPKL